MRSIPGRVLPVSSTTSGTESLSKPRMEPRALKEPAPAGASRRVSNNVILAFTRTPEGVLRSQIVGRLMEQYVFRTASKRVFSLLKSRNPGRSARVKWATSAILISPSGSTIPAARAAARARLRNPRIEYRCPPR